MDMQAIRDRVRAVGTQFLAVVEMADHPAGWEAVHHGLAALHRDLGAAAEDYERLRKLAVAHQFETYDGEFDDDIRGLVAALRAEAKAERRGRVQAENECRAVSERLEWALKKARAWRRRAQNLEVFAEHMDAGGRPHGEQAGGERPAAQDRVELKAALHAAQEKCRVVADEHARFFADLDGAESENVSLRAENDALRQQLEAVRVNRDFQAAITTELRPHRGPSLADVLDALPPGGTLSYEAPAWEEGEPDGCCGK